MTVRTGLLGSVYQSVANALSTRLGRRAVVSASSIALAGVQTTSALATPMAVSGASAMAFVAALTGQQVVVDTSQKFQTFDGVGACWTEAACYCFLNYLSAAQQAALLNRLYVTDGQQFVRVPMGSCDYNATTTSSGDTFRTYDDSGTGTDTSQISYAADLMYIVPVLKAILAVNPAVKFFFVPWTPPARFKSSSSLTSGTFTGSAANYAYMGAYFAGHYSFMKAQGITPWRYLVQNEPNVASTSYACCGYDGTTLPATIAAVGAALVAAGMPTKCMMAPDVAWGDSSALNSSIAGSTAAKQYLDAMAFHDYDGTAATQASATTASGLGKSYNTEMSYHDADGAAVIQRNVGTNDLVEAFAAGGSSGVTFYNAMLPTSGPPSKNSGLRPLVKVAPDGTGTLTFTNEYWLLAHVSRFVPPGSVRVACTLLGSLGTGGEPGTPGTNAQAVAFLRPDGSVAVFIANGDTTANTVSLVDQVGGNLSTTVTLQGADVATLTWKNPAALSVPLNPSVTVTSPSSTSVSISLTGAAPANGGSPITGYDILTGATSGSETLFVSNATLPYTITGLTSGSPVYVQVRARNAQGASGSSIEATVTPTAAAATAFLQQTFSGTAGTAITATTPSVGGAWSIAPGNTPSNPMKIDTAGTGIYAADTADWYDNAAAPPANANYYVEAVFTFQTRNSGGAMGIAGRTIGSGTSSCYAVRYSSSAGAWQLIKVVNITTVTTLGSLTAAYPTSDQTVRLTMNGTTISATVNGTSIASVTDSTITQTGVVGIRFSGSPADTPTGGIHVKSIVACALS